MKYVCLIFFFKQKSAYEMRISDWSSDVCSSDLEFGAGQVVRIPPQAAQNLDLSVKCRFFSTDVGDNLATPRYTEASIRVLKGLEPVRQRPGMYTRTENPLHILQEVIDNAADEALAGFGRQVQIGRAHV